MMLQHNFEAFQLSVNNRFDTMDSRFENLGRQVQANHEEMMQFFQSIYPRPPPNV